MTDRREREIVLTARKVAQEMGGTLTHRTANGFMHLTITRGGVAKTAKVGIGQAKNRRLLSNLTTTLHSLFDQRNHP